MHGNETLDDIKQEAHGPHIAHMNKSSCIILFRFGLL